MRVVPTDWEECRNLRRAVRRACPVGLVVGWPVVATAVVGMLLYNMFEWGSAGSDYLRAGHGGGK